MKKSADSNPLCLECGLCCNGVIFANGQLQPGDDVERLRQSGLKLLPTRNSKLETRKFRQPCAVFDGCRCRIYDGRPQYCRAFECTLLKKFLAGKIEAEPALRIIRRARRQSAKVLQLLRDLGDADASKALTVRFRRMQRQMETGTMDETSADQFGELTLAMLDLQVMLSKEFLP